MTGGEDVGHGARGSRPPSEHVSSTRMNDALDGWLENAELARIEEHLLACGPCREEYAGLSETVRALRSLPKSAEPPEEVWEAVAARMGAPGAGARVPEPGAATGAEVVPFPARVRAPRRFDLSALQLVAAALVVSLLSAGTVWVAMRGAAPASSALPAAPGVAGSPAGEAGGGRFGGTGADAGPAARAVSSDSERYADTVRRLEEILAAGRQVLAPETLASIEQSLRTVDDAIAEIEQALAADPGSDMLRRMLAAHRGTRLGVLQRAAAAVQTRI